MKKTISWSVWNGQYKLGHFRCEIEALACAYAEMVKLKNNNVDVFRLETTYSDYENDRVYSETGTHVTLATY